MRHILFVLLNCLIIIVVLTSCSNDSDSKSMETETPASEINNPLYEETIRNFEHAVQNDDAQALYDLVDLNYESDVYWTVKEAKDLIDFFMSDPFALEQQVRYLENSIAQIDLLMELGIYSPDVTTRRIPFAPADEGFVFLLPNGKLAVKVFKHTLIVNENTLGDFEKIIVDYDDTDRQFKYDESSIKSRVYKNYNNEKVIDIMNVGPGNYTIKSIRIYQEEHNEYDETIQLNHNDMLVDSERKNVNIIHPFY